MHCPRRTKLGDRGPAPTLCSAAVTKQMMKQASHYYAFAAQPRHRTCPLLCTLWPVGRRKRRDWGGLSEYFQ